MRRHIVFLLLVAIKITSALLCRVRLEWVGAGQGRRAGESGDPWTGLRVVALLNHTSLFEPVLIAAVPGRFLWQVATHGVVPVADKTAARPLAGRLFRLIARDVVPITRERDDTWTDVLEQMRDPRSLIIICPEGRMKRPGGLDLHGNPMTIRGGIADLIAQSPGGRLLIAYSGGLHHVHAPGQRFPRLFRRVRLKAEVVDIDTYVDEVRQSLSSATGPGGEDRRADALKGAVIEDLTRRRDTHCK